MIRSAARALALTVSSLALSACATSSQPAAQLEASPVEAPATVEASPAVEAPKRFEANWESLKQYQVPDWYQDAKFGIFIHWGLYAVPAFSNEWYVRDMYQQGSKVYEHHRKIYGPQDKFGYKDFIPMFKAERYDPAAWTALFKEAGARFVVPVAEHHDGFAMYDSALTPWDAKDMGPKRDLIGDLAAEVKRQGLIFGLSSHRAEHWFFLEGGRKFPSDVQDPKFEDFYGPAKPSKVFFPDEEMKPEWGPDKKFLADWQARTRELVDKYEPQLVWFDWWIGNDLFEQDLQDFAAYYYNKGDAWNKGVAINYKHKAFPDGTAVLDVERGGLSEIRPFFWQTDTALAINSWGYTEGNQYKTTDSVVDDLIDIVSKNGALLLNIGPKADGTIPEPEQRMLREIGAWLKVNGEAIYETRPYTVFGEGPTKVVEGPFNDTKRKKFTGKDIRFTRKGNTTYAIALAWPGQQMNVATLGSNGQAVQSVELLGHSAPLQFTQTASGLKVKLPDGLPKDQFAYAFRIR